MRTVPADISVVLNAHREKGLLARTLSSIRDAADFAAAIDIGVELVIVLDDAAKETTAIAHGFDAGSFTDIRRIAVDNRSLALSRNDGIAASTGTHVCISDADDLFSYNRLVESVALARRLGPQYVIVPEYLVSFGTLEGLTVLTGSGALTPLLFVSEHPYISSIFAHRTTFEAHPYVHPRGERGHAFEDWHLNAELIAAGYKYAVARNVALYYRNHPTSIMGQARSSGFPLTLAPTRLFEPETFVGACRDDVEAYALGTRRTPRRLNDNAALRDALLGDQAALAMLEAAGRIEPMISPDIVARAVPYSVRFNHPEAGLAYFRLCEIVGAQRFTDVFIVPYFLHGGAEKYVRQIIGAMTRLNPSSRILVVALEDADTHVGLDELPPNVCFLDAWRIAGHLWPQQFIDIVLKLIENTSPDARVHFRNGVATNRLLDLALKRLAPEQIVYYHFLSGPTPHFDLREPHELVDRTLADGGLVLTDNSATVRVTSARAGANPVRLVPAHCALGKRHVVESMRKKILWASRVEREKRCELLPAIAALLADHDPEISIDMYGATSERSSIYLPQGNAPGLAYRGPFSDFAQVAKLGHAIFVYTSWFDGMPNTVLEAMAHGKAVVAPDIGGIGDAVVDGVTGVLLASDNDRQRMARAYAHAVVALIYEPARTERLGRNAMDYIASQRTPHRMQAALGRLFRLDQDDAGTKHDDDTKVERMA